MNLAWLGKFIHMRYFSGGGQSDSNDNDGGEVTTSEPSKGKPPVTLDSIVDLDHSYMKAPGRGEKPGDCNEHGALGELEECCDAVEYTWSMPISQLAAQGNFMQWRNDDVRGVYKQSQMRATKIPRIVSDAYEAVPPAGDSSAVPRLFDFARRRMEERWRTLCATVGASGAFSLPEETTGYCNFAKETMTACPAFAWLRCEKEGVEHCARLLADHKIVARGGEQFGGDTRCVRINMLDRDNVFNMLVQRLSAIN